MRVESNTYLLTYDDIYDGDLSNGTSLSKIARSLCKSISHF